MRAGVSTEWHKEANYPMRFSAAVVTYTQQHEFRRPRKTLWSQFTIRHYDGANVICHRVMQKQGGVMFDVELDRMVLLCTKRMPRGLGGEGGGGRKETPHVLFTLCS